MNKLFESINRALEFPLGSKARILLAAAVFGLVAALLLPLWSFWMTAPGESGALRLDIYSTGLAAGNRGADLPRINGLGRGLGLAELASARFSEFQWMPFVIGALALVVLRAAILGKMSHLLDTAVLFFYFCLFAIWTFGHRLYAYGHDVISVTGAGVSPFMPPMAGGRTIGGIEIQASPSFGAYALVAAGLFLAAAVALSWRDEEREHAADSRVCD